MPRAAPSLTDAKSLAIRQAARRLFLEQGFAATGTDQIAAAARVSKATIYTRYRQKEELLAAVLGDMLAELEMPDLQKGVSSVAELRGVLVGLAQLSIRVLTKPDYLGLARTLIGEMPGQPELGELFAEAVPLRILGGLATLFEAAQAAGLVRATDSALAARTFIGPLLTFVLLEGLLARTPRPPTEAQLETLVDLCLGGLLTDAPALPEVSL